MATGAWADSAGVKHPVYPPAGSAETYVQASARWLEVPEERMVALVPALNGILFVGCPNCTGGTQEGQMAWNGPDDPDRVTCRFCKMVFPNDRYPEDRTLEAINRRGERETWRYHQDAKGQQYWFSARARYQAKHDMATITYRLAAAYAHTRKPEYARRAALLLNRYAEAYPRWNVMNDMLHPEAKGPISDAKPPYPYWGGIWDRWFYCDVPIELVKAYDLIYDSGEMEKLGPEAKRRLEGDVFRSSIAFVRAYKEYHSNMSPGIYDGLITVGRVLGEPDYVHDAVERMLTLYRTGFLFDGMWHEGSTSYHAQTINWMAQCFASIKGYSDPPDYRWPKDGSRLENVDLERDVPIIRRAQRAPRLLVLPDGHSVPVHDCWAKEMQKADLAAGPALLPDMGHGRLGCGSGANALQAHLHFSGGYGHQHADNLSLILFAKGQELLSDIGYTHTAWRAWATSTASHNTVEVDGRQQECSGPGGQLTLYSPQGPVQAIEATQAQSYPGITEELRRRLVLVPVDEANAYLVDLFHARGGRQHDYFLHGSSWHPQTAEVVRVVTQPGPHTGVGASRAGTEAGPYAGVALPLTGVPGTLLGPEATFELPKAEGESGKAPEGKDIAYAFFRNLREARTGEAVAITWRFTEGTKAGLRTTVLGQPGTRVVLADTPQVRPAGEDDSKLPAFLRPSLVLQRAGDAPLASAFVAVHEPFEGVPFLQDVRLLLPVAPGGPVALAIRHSAGTDYLFSSTRIGGETIEADGVRLRGRLGVVRVSRGKVVLAWLYDGTELRRDRFVLKCAPSLTGRVQAVTRDERKDEYSLVVSGKLPAGEALKCRTILVTHGDGSTHGYEVGAVEPDGERSRVLLVDDPGFEMSGAKTRFLFYPQREVEGPNTYRIDGVAAFQAR